MIKNDLKSLLATMSTGEIYQLLADLKQYASTSATIDSLKRVFESGHLLEFQLENGDTILVNEFVDAEPVGDEETRAIFSIFGVLDDLQLAIHLNDGDEWALTKETPVYNFNEVAPTFLISDDEITPLAIGAVSASVCKFQRGVYDEVSVIPDPVQVNACDKKVEKPVNAASTESDKLMSIFNAIDLWLQPENRRIIMDISRSFTFEDQYGSSSTHNNFSLAYKCISVDSDNRMIKFGNCSSDKSDYNLKLDDFINGSIQWDSNRDNLLIINEDKTYIVRINFMDGAKIIGLGNESMNNIAQLIKGC